MILLLLIISTVFASKQFSLPEGSGPDGTKLITLYQCEGEEVRLSCSAGTISIVRANFGRFSIAVCNQHGNTNWTTDCASPTAAHTIKKMCEKLQTCVVSVRPDTLGDACPSTPKYLEVHYFCKVETNPSSPRHSPHFPDTELTALWDQQNSHKVNIDSVLRAMKERENDISTQRVPITTEPESPKPSPKIQSALSDVNETNYPVQLETEVYSRDESFNDQSSTLDTQTTIETAPLPEMKERFEVENASLGWLEEEEEDPEKPPEETSNTMFVLEVVTYAVAAICGIILIFLIAKFRRTGVPPSCSCWRVKESGSGYSDSSSGSCLNSLPVEHCKMPGAGDSISPHTIGTINHCMELEPSRHISGARYSVSSIGNNSELGSNVSSPLDRVRHLQYGERSNVSPYPDCSTPVPGRILTSSPLQQHTGVYGVDAYQDMGQIGSNIFPSCHQHYPSSPYLTVMKSQCVGCLQEGVQVQDIQDYHQFSQDPYLLTRSVDSQRKCMRSEPSGSIVMGSDV
ncbi:uncharacterized protein LOC111715102 isoform X2 [Eurytemora carolleeae]|uniref:uncharacterized protein LOC111715102 isoform X2 n=1 Tax=Eurytemora carolleeae TaxID=1294199 RepID=UPI000C76BA1D|nr:uncharacterized protein LOC111715102 isoform X2 [Eurytemora carolleeae]|eukprot:XP_023346137.1 uncharacterized protein LOC111715102 isoform X2 [Eurytemora affinis]